MHHLREHSCHFEFNVHSPKIYYWLIHDYSFDFLKLFVSSRPLKLDGVICINVLLLDVYTRFYPCKQCWASKCRGL
jgi:hypothetical protein